MSLVYLSYYTSCNNVELEDRKPKTNASFSIKNSGNSLIKIQRWCFDKRNKNYEVRIISNILRADEIIDQLLTRLLISLA